MYRPSVIALGCVVCARKVSKIQPEWNQALEEVTDYTYEGEVKRCADKILKIYLK